MGTLVATAKIGCPAHASGAGWKLGSFCFSVGVGSEGRERGGDAGVAASGAGGGRGIAADELLEFCSAVFADVFKYGHLG